MAMFLRFPSRSKVCAGHFDVRALYEEGQLLMNQECWFAAEARFRQALAIAPSHGLARAHRAICLYNMSREAEAVREAERAVLSSPRESYVHFALGVVRHASGKLKQAGKSLEKALRIEPENQFYRKRLDEIETAIQFTKKR
jgi:tetratricopeptide (TPR) repeat protein